MSDAALRQRAPSFTARFTPTTPLQRRLHGSLWSWRAASWSGFVDFRDPGIYFTHWGWGTYTVDADDRTVRLKNGFDPHAFVLLFDDDLTSFRCIETNHRSDRPVGDMLFDYLGQQPPKPAWH